MTGGFVQHYGLNNTIENNLLYRVDLGIGPTDWSDGGIASGAEEAPGSPKDNSSFTFRRNIVVVESGAMFEASTSNGYRHMEFGSNVYFDVSAKQVTFPCDPDGNASWISAPVSTQAVSTVACGFFIKERITRGCRRALSRTLHRR